MWFLSNVVCVCLVVFLSACGGGSSPDKGSGTLTTSSEAPKSGDASTSSSSSSPRSSSSSSAPKVSSTDTSGDYSITVDTTAITIDVYWNRASTPQNVKIKFKGDGALVGFPPNEAVDSNIVVEPRNVTETSMDFVISILGGVRYDRPGDLKRKLRFVSGKADGSVVVYRDVDVTIRQHDGINMLGEIDALRGIWGMSAKSSFIVDSAALQWTVTSDMPGITFEPKTGKGTATVSVSYDYQKTSLTTKTAQVTLTSTAGDKLTKSIALDLIAPTLDYFPYGATVYLPDFGSTQKTIRMPVVFQQSKDIKANWSVTLPPWLSAEHTSGQTGVNDLVVYANPINAPSTEGVYDDNIVINVIVPGQPTTQQIPIKLQYEKFRYQANRQSFAFSDYGTTDAHNGVIKLSSRDLNAALTEKFAIDVSTNQSWVVIDSQNLSAINFHLNTVGLAAGFHRAEINIMPKNLGAAVAEKVSIGYYKTDSALTTGKGATAIPDIKVAVADKLGPWVYFTDDSIFDALEIKKYNLVTHTIDATYTVASWGIVTGMLVSDDGNYLYAFNGSSDKLNVFDLKTGVLLRQHGVTGMGNGASFIRINNMPFLVQGYSFINATEVGGTRGMINIERGQPRGIGDFVVSRDIDYLLLQKYSYSYLSNSIEPQTLFRVDMIDPDQSNPFYTPAIKAVRNLGISQDGEKLAVIHSDAGTYNIDNLTVAVFGFDEKNLLTKPLTLLDSVALKPLSLEYHFGLIVSNNPRYLVAGQYSGGYLINNLDLNHNVLQSFTTDSRSKEWVLLTADQKVLTYVDSRQFVYPNSAVVTENVVVTQLLK